MNHDNPHALARPSAFRNETEETVPAFAVMSILGTTTENGVALLRCGKPDTTFRRHYAVNGMQEVPAGRRGSCFRAGDARVLHGSGTPVAGAGWGPKSGQWAVAQGYPGGTIQGVVDASHQIARIDCEPIDRALVKTTATVAIDASTTAYRVYAGAPGAEVDAGFTTVPAARNRSGQIIASGQWAYLVWVHNGWELQTMRQSSLCAVPRCGEGIPARVGDEPGHNECCLFTIAAGSLVPVLDETGAQARATVYNVRDVAIPAVAAPQERYLLIHPDASGRWVCEVPDSEAAASTATTTTTSTTLAPCAGTCKWVWSSSLSIWELDSDGCALLTTTPSPTTTTADPCLCPQVSVTSTTTTSGDPATTTTGGPTSTTTSTTTTTPAPNCSCVYPSYCGSEGGECTYTGCASGDVQPSVECTTTTSTTTTSTTTADPEATTTTCDCNTTTTLDPASECTNCTWFCHPIHGWVKTNDGCLGACTCGYPSDACTGDCAQTHTPCVPLPPPPPPPPPPKCGGACQWLCIPGEGWLLYSDGCTTGISCGCIPPSEPCDHCAAPLKTGCQSPQTSTTLPPTTVAPDACAGCYGSTTTAAPTSTTSSTTTTTDPCGSGCLWDGSSSGEWFLGEDNCGPGCDCLAPSYAATDECETARTQCYPSLTTAPPTTTSTPPPTTTSTSTSTSTTTTAEPWWCIPGEDCFSDTICLQAQEDELSGGQCSGPFTSEVECEASPCPLVPTTTTSTTTTCDPTKDCSGSGCTIYCDVGNSNVWVSANICNSINAPCTCDYLPEDVALLGVPCGEVSSYAIPCCNPCAGSTQPCGFRTTTTPAP